MKLSFTTMGTPGRTPEQIIDLATRLGFQGVDPRFSAHLGDLAIRWMQQNFPVRSPIASLCDYLQVPISALEHLFFENTGELPAAYFHRLKMEHARDLLRQQSMSVKEIAFMLGYTHPNDFTRAFRNSTGKAPGNERKRAAGRKGPKTPR